MSSKVTAVWNDKLLAEADKDDLIYIEGNWYFPNDSIKKVYFMPSSNHTTCWWKGKANYYNIEIDGKTNQDGAWYYPKPTPSAIIKIKKDFTNYVAFWHGVKVSEQ